MTHNRILLAAVSFLIIGFVGLNQLSAAPQAVLANIKGKVEVKALNAATWTPATEGMVVATLTTVSTGFDSSVSIVIDKTTIHVKALTRMSVDKLVEDSGKVSTNLYLRVGTVQASVKSAEGVKQDFKVQSPYSTASVRGTDFEFDGFRLSVNEGRVAFLPGRPQREGQVPPGIDPQQVAALIAAINNSPETLPSDDNGALVPAGVKAFVSFGPDGVSDPVLSNSRDQLATDSNVKIGPESNGAGGNHASKDAHFGSLTITWN